MFLQNFSKQNFDKLIEGFIVEMLREKGAYNYCHTVEWVNTMHIFMNFINITGINEIYVNFAISCH